MKYLLGILVSLSLAYTCKSQSIDSTKIIHKILNGKWVYRIDSAKSVYMNFDDSTVAFFEVITEGPDRNTGPTTEPGGEYYTYTIAKKACFSNSMQGEKKGTIYYLNLTNQASDNFGNVEKTCYNIRYINAARLLLYNGDNTRDGPYKKISNTW